jgi:hypothetical protein
MCILLQETLYEGMEPKQAHNCRRFLLRRNYKCDGPIVFGLYHRLNVELDLQTLFGLHVHTAQLYSFSLAETPPPFPRIWAYTVYEGAIGQPR